MRVPTMVGLFAIGLGLAGGCTDPVFKPDPDGGAPTDGAVPADAQPNDDPADAGRDVPDPQGCDGGFCPGADAHVEDAGEDAPPALEAGLGDAMSAGDAGDAALDDVRATWANRYAARSALFTFDDPFKGSARLLSLIQIVPTPEGGLRLEEEMCYYEGGWSFVLTGVLKYRYVQARASAALQYSKGDFESELLKVQIGYGAAPPGCTPGATMSKGEVQSWLTSSTCDCPRTDEPPTSVRDCRVSDPEQDDEPGATFSAALDASPVTYRVTQEQRVRFEAGFRLGDRLYANRWFEDTTNILNCTINGTLTAAASCPIGSAKTCPARHNKVELVPIKDAITCEQVIAMEQALFLSPLPTFPEACPSEIAAASRQ